MGRGRLTEQVKIESLLAAQPHVLSAYSRIQAHLWQDFFSFEWKEFNGQLCLFARSDAGIFQFLPPLGGEVKADTLAACFDYMHAENQGSGVSRIENVELSQRHLFSADYTVRLKGWEYLYRLQDIAQLRGNRYKSKRSSYNQFVMTYRADYELFQPEMGAECLELYDRWMRERKVKYSDDIYRHMLDENRVICQLLFRDYALLGLMGRVVKVDGRIQGFTFGYPLKQNLFCVLFEVADLSVRGLPVFIFRRLCEELMDQGFFGVNVMDDFALPNIEKTKNSFHPAALAPSYIVTRKESNAFHK